MSHNKVSFLRQGATAAFDNTLLELRMVNCSLATFQAELSMFNALTLLDLSDNSIQEIPAGALKAVASTLTSFRLVKGKLVYLPEALRDLTALQDLDLSENPMVSTYNDALGTGTSPLLTGSAHTLRSLRLASCGLVAVPLAVSALDALKVLDLTGNDIVTLNNYQFSSLVNLELLYLKDNPLSTVPYKTFSGLSSLTMLDMSGCRLTYTPSSTLGEMPALTQLNLSSNRISVLLDNAFPKSPSLRTVDISYNNISKVTDLAFQGATAIQTLNMKSCSLTNIPRSLRLAYGLRNVYLDDNQIPCTCQSMGWIKTWKLSAGLIPQLFGKCSNDDSLAFNAYISTKLTGCDVGVGVGR
ncbi:leucine-rich repeat-containing protein 15 [Elysia marginata]|uniref:Leucine-rich repeat-containing protein 15 n=1 Tax=Elysia marginata TaxID=1093978 RepID=A0AAV4F4T2_9GAST|nr:leucine-rich repeat-containing protein 15 [Elysia marginata]